MIRKSKSAKSVESITTEANENAIFNKETEGLSQSQIVLRRFFCGFKNLLIQKVIYYERQKQFMERLNHKNRKVVASEWLRIIKAKKI